jgi:hypothetical protein
MVHPNVHDQIQHAVKIETLQDIFGKPIGDAIWAWILKRWYPTEAEWRTFDGITSDMIERLRVSGFIYEPSKRDPLPKIYDGLSVRAANALKNMGLQSKGQVEEAVRTGTLAPGKLRNYGHKSHAEICEKILGHKATIP